MSKDNNKNPQVQKLKLISLGLVLTFLFQDFAWALITLPPNSQQAPKETIELNIPHAIASIDEVHNQPVLPNSKTIILIQDAHMNASAQLNISKVIDQVLEQTDIKTVFLEGGEGDSSLSFLRPFASHKEREVAASSYLHKGLMNGAEYLNLTSYKDFKLWGVENKALYTEAIQTYGHVIEDRVNILATLSKIKSALQVLLPNYLNPSLHKLIQTIKDHESEKITASEYGQYLLETAQQLGLELNGYVMMNQLSGVMGMESRIDFEQANMDLAQITNELDDEQRNQFEHLFKDPEMIMRNDSTATLNALGDIVAGYENETPDLHLYMEYMQFMQQINFAQLNQEQEELEALLIESMITNKNERKLIEALEVTRFFEALAHMQMTSQHLDQCVNNPSQYDIQKLMAFINKKILDQKKYLSKTLWVDPDFVDSIQNAHKFYELTLKRDEAILKNTLEAMEESGESQAILLIGGYHAPNLKKRLKDLGLNYISILPRVNHATDHDQYEKILMGQYTPTTLSNKKFTSIWKQSQAFMPLSSISREPLASSNVLHIRQDFNYLGAQLGPKALAAIRMRNKSRMSDSDDEWHDWNDDNQNEPLPFFDAIDLDNAPIAFEMMLHAFSNMVVESDLQQRLDIPEEGEDRGILMFMPDPQNGIWERLAFIDGSTPDSPMVRINRQYLLAINMDAQEILFRLDDIDYVLKSDGTYTPARMADEFDAVDERNAWMAMRIIADMKEHLGGANLLAERFRTFDDGDENLSIEYYDDVGKEEDEDPWSVILNVSSGVLKSVKRDMLVGVKTMTRELILHLDVEDENGVVRDQIMDSEGNLEEVDFETVEKISQLRNGASMMLETIAKARAYLDMEREVADPHFELIRSQMDSVDIIFTVIKSRLKNFSYRAEFAEQTLLFFIDRLERFSEDLGKIVSDLDIPNSLMADDFNLLSFLEEMLEFNDGIEKLISETDWIDPADQGEGDAWGDDDYGSDAEDGEGWQGLNLGFSPIDARNAGEALDIFEKAIKNLDDDSILKDRLKVSDSDQLNSKVELQVEDFVDEFVPILKIERMDTSTPIVTVLDGYPLEVDVDSQRVAILFDGTIYELSANGQLTPRMAEGFDPINSLELRREAWEIMVSAISAMGAGSEFGGRFRFRWYSSNTFEIDYIDDRYASGEDDHWSPVLNDGYINRKFFRGIDVSNNELLLNVEVQGEASDIRQDHVLDMHGDLRLAYTNDTKSIRTIRTPIRNIHGIIEGINQSIPTDSSLRSEFNPIIKRVGELIGGITAEINRFDHTQPLREVIWQYIDKVRGEGEKAFDSIELIKSVEDADSDEVLRLTSESVGFMVELRHELQDLKKGLINLFNDTKWDEPTVIHKYDPRQRQLPKGFDALIDDDYHHAILIFESALENIRAGHVLYDRLEVDVEEAAVWLDADNMRPDYWINVMYMDGSVTVIKDGYIPAINLDKEELLIYLDGRDQILSKDGQLRLAPRMADGFEEVMGLALHWQAYYILESMRDDQVDDEYDDFRGKFDIKDDASDFTVLYYSRPSIDAGERWQTMMSLINGVPYVNKRLIKGIKPKTNELLLHIQVIGRDEEPPQDQILNIKGEHHLYKPSEKMRIDSLNAHIETSKKLKMLITSVGENDAEIRSIIGDGLGRIRLFVEGLAVSLREFDHSETTKVAVGRHIKQFTDKAQVVLEWIGQIQQLSDAKPDEVDVLTHDASGYIVQLHTLLATIAKELDALHQAVNWDKSELLVEATNAWPDGFAEINPKIHGRITLDILRSIAKKTEVASDLHGRLRVEANDSLISFKTDVSDAGRAGRVAIVAEIGAYIDIDKDIIRAINSKSRELLFHYEGGDWILDQFGYSRIPGVPEVPVLTEIRKYFARIHEAKRAINSMLGSDSLIHNLTRPLFKDIEELTFGMLYDLHN
ncbi:MAG: hypothetical protein ACI9CF_001915, partial [Candidatus Omnitrophota bacterium]